MNQRALGAAVRMSGHGIPRVAQLRPKYLSSFLSIPLIGHSFTLPLGLSSRTKKPNLVVNAPNRSYWCRKFKNTTPITTCQMEQGVQVWSVHKEQQSQDLLDQLAKISHHVRSECYTEGGNRPAEYGSSYEFMPRDFYKHLEKSNVALGQVLIYSPEMSSTQNICKNLASMNTLPHGSLVVADSQISGRGRGSNTWDSPQGCLMFSMNLRVPKNKTHCLVVIQYVAAMAVVQGIRNVLSSEDPVQIKIKWPNDILIGKDDRSLQKFGGILCEAFGSIDDFQIILGVGINISNPFPTTCLHSEMNKADSKPSRELVLAQIVASLSSFMDRLMEYSWASLVDEYTQMWVHANQKVFVEDATASSLSSSSSSTGVIHGLSVTSGCLLVRLDSDGSIIELPPDLNSFDFVTGRIRLKT